MKILLLITQSSWGGAQRYVFDLATNLSPDHDVVVACGQGGGLIEKLKVESVKLKVFDNLVREINPIKDFICFWQLFNYIRKEKFDIVHTNSSKAEILGNLAAKLAGVKKIIFTAHGFVFNEPMPGLKRKVYIWLERMANKFSNKIICVSAFDKEAGIANKIAPENKFIVIHNGIAENVMVSLAEPSFEAVHPSAGLRMTVRIGTIANLYKTKGLEYLIAAVQILNKEFDNLEFIVVGSGPEKENLTKLISDSKFPVSNFQFLTNHTTDAVNLLKDWDIFVLPSVKEGFPYTILEAMSAGLAIVATKVGGIPEAIIHEENGFLSEPTNAEELAYNLKKLILNPGLRQKMGENNKIKVTGNFSLGQMITKTKEVYK